MTHPERERESSVEGYTAGKMQELKWKKHSLLEIGPMTQK